MSYLGLLRKYTQTGVIFEEIQNINKITNTGGNNHVIEEIHNVIYQIP